MEKTGPLQFDVEKSKINWGTYFKDTMRTRGAASSQFEDYSGSGPRVVVRNAYGEKKVLEVAKNAREARARAETIANDYITLGASQWCERYDVPSSFMTSQTTADAASMVSGQTAADVSWERHGVQRKGEVPEEAQYRDEDLDEILTEMKIPIQNEPPTKDQSI
jgi:hypothetical protein